MSDVATAHVRQRMAKIAMQICRGGETESEKLRLIEGAFRADAERLVLIGTDQTILAANARRRAIKGSAT
jgi:hypothetical protein